MKGFSRSTLFRFFAVFIAVFLIISQFLTSLRAPVVEAQSVSSEPGDQGLFIAAGSLTHQEGDPAIIRSQAVTIELPHMGSGPNSPDNLSGVKNRLTLNLFEDTVLTATLERTEINADRGYSWIGRVDGSPYSLVILVVTDGLLVGEIVTGKELYRIRYQAGDIHVIQQIDRAKLPQGAPPLEPEESAPGQPANIVQQTNGDDGSVIDVLVAYTEEARIDAGGTTAMEALIDGFIAYTNQSYLNSGISQQLNLLHSQEVVYTQSTVHLHYDLVALTEFDGQIDDLHALRNQYRADLVSLIVADAVGASGIAYAMTTVSNDFGTASFSVSSVVGGGSTFGHELGHNEGAKHERYVSPEPGAYEYSHGYTSLPGQFFTIMAYGSECYDNSISCAALPYWSNPDINYEGFPMGIPEGQPMSADNRKTLNNTALTVANFRDSTAAVGSISGTVTAADDGTPLSGIHVEAHVYKNTYLDWKGFASTTTDSGGHYTIANLPADTYRVKFVDYSGDYVTEYYDNASTINSADNILVVPGATTPPADAAMVDAGYISGTITAEDGGALLSDIRVFAYLFNNDSGLWQFYDDDYSDINGQYRIDRLPAGTYHLLFKDHAGAYLSEYYNDAPDVYSADDILIVPGVPVTPADAALAIAGHITGTVTAAGGVPLSNISVDYYRYNDGWEGIRGTQTDDSGHYDIGGLPTGAYRVRYKDNSGTYAIEFYDDATNVSSADDVAVTPGVTTPAADAVLSAGGHITGTVTAQDDGMPIANIRVQAYRYDAVSTSWYIHNYADTDNGGEYDLGGLPADTYRVQFLDYSAGFYETEYYNNATNVDSANDIPVTPGTPAASIDAALEVSGRITGTVTADDSGSPLSSVGAFAYLYNPADGSWNYLTYDYTDVNGYFSINGLQEGTYRVRFWSPSGNYVAEYYNDAPSLSSADDVVVAPGTPVPPADAALATAAHITGTVTAEEGCAPLEDILVYAYRISDDTGYWVIASSDYTDTNGYYDLGELGADTYRVGYRDFYNDNYQREYYDDAPSLYSADDIVVSHGELVNGIDAALASAGARQCLALPGGWSMISSYLTPNNSALGNLLGCIENDMALIKNDQGQVYWPAQEIDTIGSWDPLEGYQINMQDAATLCIAGTQIDPAAAPLALPQGWSLVSYLPGASMPVDQALAPIETELRLAKDGRGQVYWPAYTVNQIGDMQPGQGYQLYLNMAATLTYPE